MSRTPITHTLDIAAPIDTVWALTVDLESWPEMSPTMTSVQRLDDGPLRVGSQALVKQPAQRPTTWTVTRLDGPNLFEWTAKVLSVTMTASHQLEAIDAGTTKVTESFDWSKARLPSKFYELAGYPAKHTIGMAKSLERLEELVTA